MPATIANAGTSWATTDPAATMAFRPTVRPGSKVALAPMEAPRRTTVRANAGGGWRLRGKGSLVKVAFGPTKTSSSRVTPSHSWTPHLTVTRSPMDTSFSTNT